MRINLIESTPLIKTLSSDSQQKNISDQEKKRLEKLAEAENVAKEFESIYLDMMIKTMRQTAKPEDESNAQNIFQGMLDGEYSKLMADSQSFGIRDLVLNWMKENDPRLNPNIKTLSTAKTSTPLLEEIDNSKNVLLELKKSNNLNKMAIEQYKLQAEK